MKKDSRKKTAVEVLIDTAIACGIATCLNYTILPHYIDTIESGEPYTDENEHQRYTADV